MTTELKEKPTCGKCGSNFVYVRTNGEIVCRRCGQVTKIKV